MPTDRKLLAIINGDVVGYSKMMANNEDATISALADARDVIGTAVVSHNGRLVDFTGDNFLAEFSSAAHAANCAVTIQRQMSAHEAMRFRLGVHVGDVRVEGERLYGTGVNMASRLEALSEPGGVCMSKTLYDLARSALDVEPKPMGLQKLKGFDLPVDTYAISPASLGFGDYEASDDERVLVTSIPTIAVLPFTTLSADPEHAQFAAGVTSDIIRGLSCDQRLSVIAFSSAQQHRDSEMSLREIGLSLGAAYLAEGSLRISGNRIRTSVALIDATSEVELWGGTQDFELNNLFDAIDEIVEAVVIALASHLRLEESMRTHRNPPRNITAWTLASEAYLIFVQNSVISHEEPLAMAKRATEVDPEYAFGWAVFGFLTAFKFPLGFSTDHESDIESSLASTARALQLDPRDPMGLTAHAIALQYAGRPGDSLEYLQRSLRLNPSDTLTHCYYGRGMMFNGKPELALAHFERFERLNPDDPAAHMAGMYHGIALMFMQRWAECELVARRANAASGDRNGWVWLTLAVALAGLGSDDLARDAIGGMQSVAPHWNFEFVNGFLSECQADAQLMAPITEILERICTR